MNHGSPSASFHWIAARLLRACAVAFLAASASCSRHGAEGAAAGGEAVTELRELTGAHTRVAWCQDMGGGSADPFANGHTFRLMGYDSDDDAGERIILEGPSNFSRPLITPRGDRVIFSTRGEEKIRIVNWDGSGLRDLAAGLALSVWTKPESGEEWVYAGTRIENSQAIRDVRRFPVDRPEETELVWDKTPVEADNAQVCATGRLLSGGFPWPYCGIAELPNIGHKIYANGCWPSIAPNHSGLFWIFDGAHRNLAMFRLVSDERWLVNINNAPGIAGLEVYHPRWSNHARFMTMTGPYTVGDAANRIWGGGTNVEVYVGMFSADFRAIERWTRITHNRQADFYPDVWVRTPPGQRAAMQPKPDGPSLKQPAESGRVGEKPVASEAEKRDRSDKRLVVEARLVESAAIPKPESILPYTRALVAEPYEVLKVIEGRLSEQRVLIARWVIRDRKALENAERQPGRIYRTVLAPFDSHPELEGERLIMDSDEFMLHMYYELEAQ